jgi:hypothetical protein
LYLKSPAAFQESLSSMDPEMAKSKLLRAIAICLLYGYFDYALELVHVAGDRLTSAERASIEARLSDGGVEGRAWAFPGRRTLSRVFRRLWKHSQPAYEGWSVGDAELGNHDR